MAGSPPPSYPRRANGNPANGSGSGKSHSRPLGLKLELAILLSLLAALSVLAIRPFGFRTFLFGISHDDIYSVAILIGIVAVIVVIMQRLGIIFSNPDNNYNYYSNPSQ
jgi:hypothetical protein